MYSLLYLLLSVSQAQTTANDAAAAVSQDMISFNFAQGGADWGGLCVSGHSQSPIDIISSQAQIVSEPNFSPVFVTIPPQEMPVFIYEMPLLLANGTIQAELNSIEVEHYLTDSRMHMPGEHLIDGVRYPLELHASFISSNSSDPVNGTVLVFLFQEGAFSPFIDNYIQGGVIDFSPLIPEPIEDYFFYSGGRDVPVPDCIEPIYYLIPNQIYEAGPEQIQALQSGLYAQVIAEAGVHGQYKDVQPLNGRTVYHRVEQVEGTSFLT